MKIYTKQGDSGTSSTPLHGKRGKQELIFELVGALDELNVALCQLAPEHGLLLLDIGAYFTTAKGQSLVVAQRLAAATAEMERQIDWIFAEYPLTKFVLPQSSWDQPRVLARRAERVLCAYLEEEDVVDPEVRAYLNRLSDYCFARGHEEMIKSGTEVVYDFDRSTGQVSVNDKK